MKTPEQIEFEIMELLTDLVLEETNRTKCAKKIIELFNSNRLTDEQIDAMFPEPYGLEVHYNERRAARQVRDLLQGKGGEG